MPFYRGRDPIDHKKERTEQAAMLNVPVPQSQQEEILEQNQNQQYTQDQIEAMRRVVMESDKARSQNVFDLSKPNVMPYKYEPFPKMLYDHKRSKAPYWRERVVTIPGIGITKERELVPAELAYKIVDNEEQLKQALAEGYRKDAPRFDAPGESAGSSDPFDQMDEQEELAASSKKRGR